MMLTVQTVIRDYFTDETGRKLISADKLYRMSRKKEIPALRLEGHGIFPKKRWIAGSGVTISFKEKWPQNTVQ